MRVVSFLLNGVGQVGRRFLEIVVQKRALLRERYALAFVLIGCADRGGVAWDPSGIPPEQILEMKRAGQTVAALPRVGKVGIPAQEMVRSTPANLLIEASPADLRTGQPGLGCIEAALARGMDVVTANKAPLALAFPHLERIASASGARLRFSATVGGGLPAVNLGRRDLAGAEITRVEAILNLTSHAILCRMEEGIPFDQALAQMQAAGHAEADPYLDIDGWDAAEKLVIVAWSILRYPASLPDVHVEGISAIRPEALWEARASGQRIRLVALAQKTPHGYNLSVGPLRLPEDHPLARLGPEQMGIVYHTDIAGVLAASIVETTPMPTAAAILRDVLDLYAPA
ncbi:MAG: homoserine dehydrogenase [Chloroflexia bacterium]